jgi:flagellar hook-length control protein FliK
MRFSVSRVAAEAQTVLPSRPPLPIARATSNADSRDARPFADLLDSPPPAAEPPPAPQAARTERPERPNRADQPKPADIGDKGNAEAKPAKDNADAKDAQDAKHAKDAKDSTDTKTATDGSGDAKSAKDAKDGKAPDATTDAKAAKDPKAAGDKPKADADQTAALDAMFVDAATPAAIVPQATAVAIIQPLVLAAATPEAGTPEADALAALQTAAGQSPRATPDATKPGQTQGGDKPADASAKGAATDGSKGAATAGSKGAATAGPPAAVPELESGKDGQTHGSGDGSSNGNDNGNGNGDKALSEFPRAAAELLTKVDVHAPAPSGGDAASAVKATADAVQNLGVNAPASTTTSTPVSATATAPVPAQAQAQAPAVAVPLSGLAVEITTQAHAGRNHFEIRLDPPDLGRINVKLDVDSHGNVTTHLVVDRADTLDLLKRDASSLERALQQAGLKTSDHALDFSLRQHSFAEHDTPAQTGTQHVIVPDDDPAPLEALRQGYGRLLGLSGGLDIRV